MKNLKSKVFTIAHQIKSTFDSFSDALKAAWKIAKISFGIPTKIKFTKQNKEERTANALNIGSIETIKKGFVRFLEMKLDGTTQWRSFTISSLILN